MSRILLLIAFFMISATGYSYAQRPDLRDSKPKDENMNGIPDDQEKQDEDDEEEEDDWEQPKPSVPKFPEAMVTIDGREQAITEDFVAYRNKKMAIKVTRLLPMSWLKIEVEKVGVGLTKTQYQANELGEIELEINTGKTKAKASVIYTYFSSDGKAHKRKAFVRID